MKVNHSFGPFYNENSKVLILGSFPSVISRKESFFYMNKTNRFWKVMGLIFEDQFNDFDISIKKALLEKYNIALYDVIEECDIVGSSDSSIKDVKPINLNKILLETQVKKIFINGKTAHKYFVKYFSDYLDMAICLPSTSAANAKMRLDDLYNEWKIIKK